MEIGTAEVIALVGAIVIAVKVIDKLADALLAKFRERHNSRLNPNDIPPEESGRDGHALVGALWRAATAMEETSQQVQRLCELQKEARDQLREGFQTLGQRLDRLYRRGDE